MNLLHLPEPLIEVCVLPFLPWNDLLRFRRVSKVTNRITTAYMRGTPELAPEIEINERDRTFGAFMKMYIPTTKIFLNNESGDEFYENDEPNMNRFLEEYGSYVTSLRVLKISLYLHGNELKFLDSLPNLRYFEAGHYAVGKEQKRQNLVQQSAQGFIKDPHASTPVLYPAQFQYLKSIKIGQDCVVENILKRLDSILNHFTDHLTHVSLPFTPYISQDLVLEKTSDGTTLEPQYSLTYAFVSIMLHINTRKGRQSQSMLEVIDFTCFNDTSHLLFKNLASLGSNGFLFICKQMDDNQTKFLNVNAEWFMVRTYEPSPELVSIEQAVCVMSVVNLHPGLITLEMPNLERIDIRSTFECIMPPEPEWRNQRIDWPSLKSLNINVDSKSVLVPAYFQCRAVNAYAVYPTKSIFDFCFKGISRLALVDLRLNFVLDEVPVPKVDEIVESCPNLKKLTLINWLGTNKALLKLWEGLPGLEEITLDKCRNVGNVAFVGMDIQNPAFFKLKKLKKLSLKGLDRMPKITDTLFSMVIRHLSLSHLTITSDKPVESVTMAGIRTLQEGQFAASIEKFPFQDWSLAGVSKAEFKKLETQFRSYEMI